MPRGWQRNLPGPQKSPLKDLSTPQETATRVSVFNGMWLSLVERCVRDAEIARSNRAIPTRAKSPRGSAAGAFCFLAALLPFLCPAGKACPPRARSDVHPGSKAKDMYCPGSPGRVSNPSSGPAFFPFIPRDCFSFPGPAHSGALFHGRPAWPPPGPGRFPCFLSSR